MLIYLKREFAVIGLPILPYPTTNEIGSQDLPLRRRELGNSRARAGALTSEPQTKRDSAETSGQSERIKK